MGQAKATAGPFHPPTRLLNRNYLLLWQGQAVSMLGACLSRMALILWVAETTNSATMMGTLMMIAALPNIVVGPIAGAVADRYPRKKIIVVCDLLSALFSLILAGALAGYASMPALATGLISVAYVCQAITSLFFNSAVVAFTPDLVPADKVPTANALEMALVQAADFLGRGLSGVLYRILGGAAIFVLDGITFIFSAASESFIVTFQKPLAGPDGWGQSFAQLCADTKEGFRYVLRNHGLRSIIIVYGGINFCLEPFMVLLPFYVKDPRFLGAPVDWTGYLFSGLAVGTTIGYWLPTLLPKSGRGIGWLMIGCTLAMSLGYGALGIVKQPWIALLLMTGNGLLSGLNSNYIYSLLQTTTPADMRGRVMSVLTVLVMSVSPLAMGMSGVAADLLNQRLDYIFLTSGAVMAAVVVWGATRKEFRCFITGKAG